jgi:hypothetical protein
MEGKKIAKIMGRGSHEHIDSSGAFICPLGSTCDKPNAGEQFDAMLEALELAAPWLGKLIANNVHLECVMPNHAVRTLQKVEAAIAKAKGESNES